MKNVRFGTLDGNGYSNATALLTASTRDMKEGSLNKIDEADCIVVVGADLVKDHQVAGFLVKRNLPNGTKLILVDERSNQLAPFADAVLEPEKDFSSILQQLADGVQATNLGQKTDLGKAVSFIRSAEKVVLVVGKLPTGVSSEEVSAFEKALRSKAKSLEVISLKGQANSYAAYLIRS